MGRKTDGVRRWGLDVSGSLQGAGGTLDRPSAHQGQVGGLLAMQNTQGTADAADDVSYAYFYEANGNVGQLVNLASGALSAVYEYPPIPAHVETSRAACALGSSTADREVPTPPPWARSNRQIVARTKNVPNPSGRLHQRQRWVIQSIPLTLTILISLSARSKSRHEAHVPALARSKTQPRAAVPHFHHELLFAIRHS